MLLLLHRLNVECAIVLCFMSFHVLNVIKLFLCFQGKIYSNFFLSFVFFPAFSFSEFQEFMRPEKDEYEYYKNVDGENILVETPVVNSKLANGLNNKNNQRKISSPCISLSKPETTSRQQRLNSLPFVRHLSHPSAKRLISKT